MDPDSQDINLNSPNKGLVVDQPESMSELPVEGAVGNSANPLPPGLTEEEAVELQIELIKVEEEISTLRQVLVAKEKQATDLKRKLGLSPLNELKQNLSKSWQDVQASNAYVNTTETLRNWNQRLSGSDLIKRSKWPSSYTPPEIFKEGEFMIDSLVLAVKLPSLYLSASATLDDIARSEAYKKTQETISQASMKTTAALSTMGSAFSRRLGDMRNSTTFKSFEDRVETLKYKVVGPKGDAGSPADSNPTQDNAPF